MKTSEFCFWLQGFFELRNADTSQTDKAIDASQVEMIERHLALVFKHDIDPSQGPPKHQAELQAIHDGKPAVSSGQEIYRC